MGVRVRASRVDVPTTSSTTTLTIPGVGRPKGVRLECCLANSTPNASVDELVTSGVSDLTNHGCVGVFNEFGASTSFNSHRAIYDDRVLAILDSTGALLEYAVITGIVEDGVTLEWRDGVTELAANPTRALSLVFTILAGSDTTVNVGTVTANLAVGTEQTISLGMSGIPDGIAFAGVGSGPAIGTPTTQLSLCSGWSYRDNVGAISQVCRGYARAAASLRVGSGSYNTRVLRFALPAGEVSNDPELECTAMAAGSFGITKRTLANNASFTYMAVCFNGRARFYLDQPAFETRSTEDADQSVTAPGFRPQWVEMITTNLGSGNQGSNAQTNLSQGNGLAVFSASGGGYWCTSGRNRSSGTADTCTLSDPAAGLEVLTHTGTRSYRVDFTALTDSGFDYTIVNGTGNEKFATIIAIERVRAVVNVA